MDKLILHIETATKACSIALSNNGKLIAAVEAVAVDYSHAEQLNVFVEQAFKEANLDLKDLVAVAVSKGPGSFTGLRIGVSSAKGFAYALDIPLISCNTLDCLATGFLMSNTIAKDDLIIPMIDARRKEVYMKVIDPSLNSITEIEAKIIDGDSFSEYTKAGRRVHLTGDGAAKFEKEFADNANVLIYKDTYPSASFMLSSAWQSFQNNTFEDLAYFEPFYLKDFIAIKPRKIF